MNAPQPARLHAKDRVDPVALEGRLVRIESKVDGIAADVQRFNSSLDRHERMIAERDTWSEMHDLHHAREQGQHEGATQVHAAISMRDKFMFGLFISVAMPVTMKLFEVFG